MDHQPYLLPIMYVIIPIPPKHPKTWQNSGLHIICEKVSPSHSLSGVDDSCSRLFSRSISDGSVPLLDIEFVWSATISVLELSGVDESCFWPFSRSTSNGVAPLVDLEFVWLDTIFAL